MQAESSEKKDTKETLLLVPPGVEAPPCIHIHLAQWEATNFSQEVLNSSFLDELSKLYLCVYIYIFGYIDR